MHLGLFHGSLARPLRINHTCRLQCTSGYPGYRERDNDLSTGNSSGESFATAGNCDTVSHW